MVSLRTSFPRYGRTRVPGPPPVLPGSPAVRRSRSTPASPLFLLTCFIIYATSRMNSRIGHDCTGSLDGLGVRTRHDRLPATDSPIASRGSGGQAGPRTGGTRASPLLDRHPRRLGRESFTGISLLPSKIAPVLPSSKRRRSPRADHSGRAFPRSEPSRVQTRPFELRASQETARTRRCLLSRTSRRRAGERQLG